MIRSLILFLILISDSAFASSISQQSDVDKLQDLKPLNYKWPTVGISDSKFKDFTNNCKLREAENSATNYCEEENEEHQTSEICTFFEEDEGTKDLSQLNDKDGGVLVIGS